MKCPNCGTYGDGKYCSNCGTEFPKEEILTNHKINKKTDLPLKGIIVAIVIVFLIGLLITTSDNDVSTTSTKEDENSYQQTVNEEAKKQYDSGLALIEAKKYNEAFKKLKEVPNSSTYYSQAQAKIKEILNPLAHERLKLAKKYFDEKNYGLAYVQLQEASETTNPPLPEAKKLLPIYEKKKNQQEEAERKEKERQEKELARKEHQEAKARMERYESGIGQIQIAVKAKITHRVNARFGGSWTANPDSQFVWLNIYALNNGTTTEHVNPNDFTLSTPDGYTANPDTDTTYSQSNYFDATDLSPNTYTSGWLIFCMTKQDKYTLHYKGFNSQVDKEIILN